MKWVIMCPRVTPAKVVLWHALTVGHGCLGRGFAGKVPRKTFVLPAQFDPRDCSLSSWNESATTEWYSSHFLCGERSAEGELPSDPTRGKAEAWL